MHRKGRLNLIFRLSFPGRQTPFEFGGDIAEQLDLREWFGRRPAGEIGSHGVYRDMITKLERLDDLAREALAAAASGGLSPEGLSRLLWAMHEFDHAADRLDAGITKSLTDLDELTGLLNRASLERDLAREMAQTRRSGRTLTVAMVDADYFKKVNDEFGHAFGDVVLKTLAQRFIDSLRPRDQVYRYGGEEFLVVLPETPLDKALPVLERLRRKACETPISEGGVSISQSISAGVAQTAGDEAPAAVVERADQALYRAKEAGRNRIETS